MSDFPDFPVWLAEVSPTWQWNWQHQLFLYEKLSLVTSGDCNRLMIFMPPRHGKSETVTVHYSAYRLVKNPLMNVIIGCYNQKLANRFSRKIRRIAVNRLDLSKERKAAEEWETAAGGGVRAVGVGAGVTGFGAGLILIDDPVKSRAEAESANQRDRVWDWFNDDIYTRLEPGGTIVLIQTRWHEDDLAGRLIREMKEGGEKWKIISLPALAEPASAGEAELEAEGYPREEGEPLCPERFDRAALLKIQKKLGSYSFAALYQQRPVPLDGGLFKRAWFRRLIDKAPDGLQWARGYDLAVSIKTSADYTASFRCAFDKEGNLIIADGYRGRIEFPEQRKFLIEKMLAEKNTRHGIEKALHGQAFVQELRRVAEIRHVPLKDVKVDGDKFTRALAWANLAEEGRVILVRGAWNDEFLDEVCQFPGGQHDDQVDAVSLAVRMLSATTNKLHRF